MTLHMHQAHFQTFDMRQSDLKDVFLTVSGNNINNNKNIETTLIFALWLSGVRWVNRGSEPPQPAPLLISHISVSVKKTRQADLCLIQSVTGSHDEWLPTEQRANANSKCESKGVDFTGCFFSLFVWCVLFFSCSSLPRSQHRNISGLQELNNVVFWGGNSVCQNILSKDIFVCDKHTT